MNEVNKVGYAGIYLALSVILVFIQIPIFPNNGIAIDLALVPIIIARRHIGNQYAIIIAFIYPWFTLVPIIVAGALPGVLTLILLSLMFIISDYLFEKKSILNLSIVEFKCNFNKNQSMIIRTKSIRNNFIIKEKKSFNYKHSPKQYSFFKMQVWHFFAMLIISFILLIFNLYLFWPMYLHTSSIWIPNVDGYYWMVAAVTFGTTFIRYCAVYLFVSLFYPKIYHYL